MHVPLRQFGNRKDDLFPFLAVGSALVRVDDDETFDLDDAARRRLVDGLDAPVLLTSSAVDLLLLLPVVVAARTGVRFRDHAVLELAVDDDVVLPVDGAYVRTPAAQIVALQAPASHSTHGNLFQIKSIRYRPYRKSVTSSRFDVICCTLIYGCERCKIYAKRVQ